MDNLQSQQLLQNISALLDNARKRVVVAVNQTMVLTYFEIGRVIVEDGRENIENSRIHFQRFLNFGRKRIVQTLFAQFGDKNSSTLLTNSLNYISETLFRKLEIIYNQKSQTLSDLFIKQDFINILNSDNGKIS